MSFRKHLPLLAVCVLAAGVLLAQSPGSRPAARSAKTTAAARTGDLLSRGHGQYWQAYDLAPYTSAITSTNQPEQAVVDWVLRETGYEVWHREPMSVLCADRDSLKVYAPAELHDAARQIVERFTSTTFRRHAFALRVISLRDSSWRLRASQFMEPAAVESPGVQAWLVGRDNAAMLLAEMARRSDYLEFSSPNLLVYHGESHVLSQTNPKTYSRRIALTPGTWPGYELVSGQIDEGIALEVSPLLSADGATVDAVVKCHIDDLETLHAIPLDVASGMAPRQRAKVEVPQVSHFRMQEKFRWPADRVLLIALGMVPAPLAAPEPLSLRLVAPPPARADVLIFLEPRGAETDNTQPAAFRATRSHGRY
ncbi:MAG: hypothetical protein HYS13_20840 [Planctomycetia bacterium]|nr:hypothetical protein [Planctomycetia bacterium]